MKIAILTLGCKTNQSESLHIEKYALSQGNEIVPLKDQPDLCIINTCSVTSKADYQSRQLINRALKESKNIIVTGCYAQLNKELLLKNSRLKFIDNKSKDELKNYLNNKELNHLNKLIELSRTRPIIKIQEGCNNNCSYCSIIYSRGRARSREVISIINDINDYSMLGYKEIVLTGTNIGQYGIDLKGNINLKTLLYEILEKTNISRVRLSSIEINYIDSEFINIIKNNKICKHLHIPLQSADNNILKSMNRPYTIEEFSDKIISIKENMDDISIGSDVIVGYPLETDNEFNNTYNFLQEFPFSYFHVFKYSKRANTLSSQYSIRSSFKEIDYRSKRLINLSKNKKRDFISSQIGKINEIIIEDKEKDFLFGTSSNYIKTYISEKHTYKPKDLVKIRFISFHRDIVLSEPII